MKSKTTGMKRIQLIFCFIAILILIPATISTAVTSTVTINSTDRDEAGGEGSRGSCTTSWVCSDWGKCTDGKQQRVCSKKFSGCYAGENKPSENQNCKENINDKKINKYPSGVLNTKETEQDIISPEDPNGIEKTPPEDEIPQILFDISIKAVKKNLLKIEKFAAVVKLMNLGIPGQVNAKINYTVRDSQYILIYQETQIVLVETQTEFIKEFPFDNMTIGKYTITADLNYNGQIAPAQSIENFEVTNEIKNNIITKLSNAIKNFFDTILRLFKIIINWIKSLL